MNLLDIFEGREPYQQAIDKLEQRRIEDLEARMDDCARRGDKAGFHKAKAKRDSYFKVKTNEAELDEKLKGLPTKKLGTARDVGKSIKKFRAQRGLDEGSMKHWLEDQAELLSKDQFVANAAEYGMSDEEAAEFWDNWNGVELDEGEMKRAMEADAERMSLEKFVAKYGDEGWIREFWNDINGPLDEAGIGQDIVNKTEKMARATPPSKAGAVASTVKNAAKWLAGKGGPGKEGPTYESAQKKNSKEIDEHGGGGGGPRQWHAYVRAHRADESTNPKLDALIKNIQARVSKDAVKRPEIMKRVAQMVQQADPEVQDALATAQQLVQQYGQGVEPKPTNVNDIKAQARSGNVMAQLPKTSAGTPSYAQQHSTFEGWSDAIVAQRTGKPRTPYSVYIKGKKWKDFENDDHAEAVANKLRAKFKAEGRDPSVITIAPTDYDKDLKEAGTAGLEDTIRQLMAPAYEEETGGWFGYTLEKKAPTMARLRNEYSDDLNDIFYNATPEELHQAAQELKAMYGQIEESKEAVFRSHDIEVEYPEGKGHSHIYHRREPYRLSTIFSDANSVAARNRRAKISLFVDGEYIPNYEWQEGVDAPNGGIAEDVGSWIVYDPKTKQIKKRFKTHTAGKSYAKTHGLGFASSEYYFDNIKPAVTAEGMTDFQKRRQRERDVDMGKPVARQRPSKQTDYQKRRAQDKKDMEMGEEKTRLDPKCWKGKKIGNPKTKMKGGVRVNNCVPAESVEEEWSEKYKRSIDCSHPKGFSQKAHCAGRKKNEGMFSPLEENNEARDAVESAIIRRIMVARTDLLKKFGPQKVMDAAQAVADEHSDVEEIGTSDVSAFIQQVERYLAMNH